MASGHDAFIVKTKGVDPTNKYEKRLRQPYRLLSGTLKGSDAHTRLDRMVFTLMRAGQFIANPPAFIRWEMARRKQYQEELQKMKWP